MQKRELLSPQDEARLLKGIRGRDEQALSQLMEHVTGYLIVVADSMLRNLPDAEEVVQDVIVDFWSRCNSISLDSLGDAEKIVAGKWFSANQGSDLPQVSLESDLAKQLHVTLGSTITWDVQGVLIPTRITSLRSVKWTRFEPNFFAIFQPGTLADAPKQYILMANIPGQREVALLQRDVVSTFPNVSGIDLSLVQQTVDKISSRVSTAIKFIALFSVAMGIPVLFSAFAATQGDRMRENRLLRVLGATRSQIAQILSAEYTALSVLGICTGLLLGVVGSWGIMRIVF